MDIYDHIIYKFGTSVLCQSKDEAIMRAARPSDVFYRVNRQLLSNVVRYTSDQNGRATVSTTYFDFANNFRNLNDQSISEIVINGRLVKTDFVFLDCFNIISDTDKIIADIYIVNINYKQKIRSVMV